MMLKQLVSSRRRRPVLIISSSNVGLNVDQLRLIKLMSSSYHFLNIIMLIMFMMMMISVQPSASQPTTTTRLPQYEVTALEQIGKSLGKEWNFSVNPCSGDSGWITPPPLDAGYENNVTCNCPQNGTLCHVQSIVLKGQGLAGNLPRQLTRLSSLQFLDLSRNYLNGTIPEEWGSMRLLNLSLMSNRLSGPIPKELGNIITLQDLSLEGNMFSGQVPPEIGNLTSLIRLLLSSNNFTGELPATFSKLTNIKDFRISDNAFTGKIPDYITSWTALEKLSIQGTHMEGPFPVGINSLTNLTRIMVSDLGGTFLEFPQLSGLKKLRRLTIRNSRLSGQIPESIGELTNLQILDLSFNNLTGVVPSSLKSLKGLDDLFLTSNNLTGLTPEWILRANMDLDLSYNNFTGIISGTTPDCTQGNVNLVESISKNLKNQNSISTCLRKDFPCASKKPQYSSLHINCGSKEAASNGTTIYEADGETRGAATLFISNKGNWAFSSTGIFIDNDQPGYIATNSSILNMSNPELYKTARLTPLSLKYYGLCLWNGAYTVKLHFAEIVITDDKNFTSLGRRIFDIYIQGVLVQKDFNIKEAANGSNKAFILTFPANVSSNTLEIHLFWAGKGTTAIPKRGVYGPLISALSIEANFTPPEDDEVIEKRKIIMGVTIGLASFIFLTLFILAILWKKGCLCKPEKELRGLDLQTGSFSLRQIKSATKNFDSSNKIGEGGFGPVYKGHLSDGTTIAVKQLSSKSRQGNREFVNEIGMISALQHPNLVKLYGCCIEGHQLHLVYEYMENNCLARALFGRESQRLKLDWPTRRKICIGIARGLTYLHEESPLKIVHRDIKSTNILLDKDLNAKISDFGLAKLEEEGHTHISTRIAGTIGYMAPEYAMRGHLTYRADIYSFGIVALEIISGKSNTNSNHEDECFFLLDWACVLQDRGDLLDMVDPELGTNYSKEEVLTVINIALLCTNSSPSLRPTMSTVVSMLEGKTTVHPQPQSPELSSAELNNRIRYILHQQSKRRTDKDSADGPWTGSSESAIDNSERTELSELLRNSSKDISLA